MEMIIGFGLMTGPALGLLLYQVSVIDILSNCLEISYILLGLVIHGSCKVEFIHEL